MNYAIIGSGNIGQARAKTFARNGIEVSVAATRDPKSFASARLPHPLRQALQRLNRRQRSRLS